MGLFSRLFGWSAGPRGEGSGAAEEASVFRIPWCSEAASGDCELRNAYVLISDIEGVTASDIKSVRDRCRQARRPLVLVTPGVDPSIVPLLGQGDTTAIKATPLPDQPLRGLLDDVAAITGGTVLCKPLGFGLSFLDSLSGMAEKGICIPRHAWDGLTLNELGRADRLLINHDGTELRKSGYEQRDVEAYTTRLLCEAPTPGRDERLRRLWTAAGCLPDEAKALAMLPSDFSPDYAIGLASSYFVTDANTLECLLEDALIAVFGEPLTDLEALVRLLGRAARTGRPLLIFAPSVSDEALAICVVNRLRGVLQCAVAVPVTSSQDVDAMLTDVACRTGAKVIMQSDAHRLQRVGFLGNATTIRATCSGIALTAMAAEMAREEGPSRSELLACSTATPKMTATVAIDNRIVPVQFSEGTLHLTEDYSGNLDFSLWFSESVPIETVLENLRVRIPGTRRMLKILGSCEIPGGWNVTVDSALAPPGTDVPAGKVPATAEVFWLNNSTREPVAQLTVVAVPE